jgi:MOSC domain-containing protein YiiM
MMNLLSVNVSLPKHVPHGDKTVVTGIFKEPVGGRVMLRRLNLEGDGQADLQNHGGEYKAVYAYAIEHYDFWKRELGRDGFPPGQFGENFTVQGMTEDDVHIGDVFHVGSALIQVTQPRSPCYKLALKMGLPHFPKQFLASGRVGFYLRVLEEGEVGAGDAVERVLVDPERLTVREMLRLLYAERDDRATIERALRIQALSPRRRAAFQERLCRGGECG